METVAIPLEMSSSQRQELIQAAVRLIDQLRNRVDTAPIFGPTSPEVAGQVLEPPGEDGTPLADWRPL